MNHWSMLELEPTTDLALVKKAYAKLLKKYHPEEDAEGYQCLREAYDLAVKYCKANHEKESLEQYKTDAFSHTHDREDEFVNHYKLQKNVVNMNYNSLIPSIQEQWLRLYDKAEKLYMNFYERIIYENWEELMTESFLWEIDHHEACRFQMLEFIRLHPFLPQAILRLLEEHFQWSLLISQQDYDAFEYVMDQLCDPFPLSYDYFEHDLKIQFDTYLELRFDVYLRVREKALFGVQRTLDECREIYGKDPELAYIDIKYDIRIYHRKDALAKLNKLIGSYPNDYKYHLERGLVNFAMANWREAAEDLELVMCQKKMAQIAHQPLVKSYLKCGAIKNVIESLERTDPEKTLEYLKFVAAVYNESIMRLTGQLFLNPFKSEKRRLLKAVHRKRKENKKQLMKITPQTGITLLGVDIKWPLTIFTMLILIGIIIINPKRIDHNNRANVVIESTSGRTEMQMTMNDILVLTKKKLPVIFSNAKISITLFPEFRDMKNTSLPVDIQGDRMGCAYLPIGDKLILTYFPYFEQLNLLPGKPIIISGTLMPLMKEKVVPLSIHEKEMCEDYWSLIRDRYLIIKTVKVSSILE